MGKWHVLRVSHVPYPQGVRPPALNSFGVLPYLCLQPLMLEDQNQRDVGKGHVLEGQLLPIPGDRSPVLSNYWVPST